MSTILTFIDSDVRLGFHITKDGNVYDSFERMTATPLRSYQIYLSNGRSWDPPRPTVDELRMARHHLKRLYRYACVHGCLLYNMAGMTGGPSEPNYRRNLENTRIGLTAELDAAAGFGGGVVVHIGSAKDKSLGMSTISSTIEDVLTRTSSTTFQLSRGLDIPEQEFIESRKIILENAAGEGNKIGSNLDEIAEIIRNTREELHPQIKVMIDTAHLFGAGEGDMGSPKSVKKFFQEFDEKIGLSYLEGFHLNDSRVPFRSRKDRHENIGKGYIFGNLREEGDGLDGLKKLIDFSREQELVLIGEPPGKTRDGEKGMGGIWDYQVIKHVCGLDTCKFVCCD